MSLLPHYTHIINPKLKHIYLSLDDEGNIVIKSPKVSQQYIEKFLLKKSSWITQTRQKLSIKKGKKIDFLQSPKMYYLGSPYPLLLMPHDKKKIDFYFDSPNFILRYSLYNEEFFQKHIDHFYKTEAKSYLTPLIQKWAKSMNLSPEKINFRKTKRQWGSCTHHNHLSFNTMMMKLPLNTIEYIIIHELAHIKHKHHQTAFWKCVAKYLPSYKIEINILKSFTP